MRQIDSTKIVEAVKKLAMEAACELEPDILEALIIARDRETSLLAKNILKLLLTNAAIASRQRIPICQDTGSAVIFLALGQDVYVKGNLTEAVQDGIRAGYDEGFLRKSICDPLTRENTKTNLPAVIHLEMIEGEHLHIVILPKGCGSENMSALTMLPPAAGIDGIVDYVADRVIDAGANPCPPVVVGVGLGGTFEKAALLAKKSLLRPVGDKNLRNDVAELEAAILKVINKNGRGVEGFGGNNTALAVHIDIFPCHIASLPVAVNIQCHAHRHKEIVL